MDTTDRRILRVLQQDVRITMTALAERISMSVPATAERVHRLETFVAKDGNTYTVTAIGDDFLYFHDFSYSQNCSEVVLPKTSKKHMPRARVKA